MSGVCLICGKPLPTRRRSYCSDACRTERWKRYWDKKIEEGKKVAGYRPMTWGYIRNEKLVGVIYCERCGKLKESGETLEVHHRCAVSVGGNNELSNLIVLCHKCHRAEHKGKPRGSTLKSTQDMLVKP